MANLFMSGRLCLFGEHSDWAASYGTHAGHCVVVGTDQGMAAEAEPADVFSIETRIPDSFGRPTGRLWRMSCPWDEQTLLAAARDERDFFRYAAGVAFQILQRYEQVKGLRLRITSMDLPLGKGVSSSAAVCTLVASAFNRVYGLRLFPREIMELAYLGERLTGSQCGRMDQACIYGSTPVLLTFETAGDVRVEPIPAAGGIFMFFVDLAGAKNTVRILEDLRAAYPRSREMQDALGPGNEGIVRRACLALESGDGETLGELMTEAQAAFDARIAPHCPQELAGPLLHEVLACEAVRPHVFGGKGVGSQGDGTAQFVARSREDRDAATAAIGDAFENMHCFPLDIAGGWRGAHGAGSPDAEDAATSPGDPDLTG